MQTQVRVTPTQLLPPLCSCFQLLVSRDSVPRLLSILSMGPPQENITIADAKRYVFQGRHGEVSKHSVPL